MLERPILFQGAMVRAILDRSKTQTRRPLYVLTKSVDQACFDRRYRMPLEMPPVGKMWTLSQWRKAKAGDRLWVRETWAQNWNQLSDTRMDRSYVYRADGQQRAQDNGTDLPWRPSIHMPRAASRITLEITGVRVERLQDISEADAVAEGTPCYVCGGPMDGRSEADCHCFHRKAKPSDYRALWEEINGPASWDANPWVWVVEFKRVNP